MFLNSCFVFVVNTDLPKTRAIYFLLLVVFILYADFIILAAVYTFIGKSAQSKK
ncbi:hypothetical protein RV10_GL004503 [Enterococcus pallens]|nr:hypothetical protein RV10_GL004503 [Enterococcus pallens]